MRYNPGLTVVVPVYNAGTYLARCLESLTVQTAERSRFDVVVVDDGSTDGSGEQLDRFAAEHPGFVRVEHIENSGWPGRPRNLGTDLSTREYVFYCDADDWLMPDAVETILDRAAADDSDVVMVRAVGNRRRVPHAIYERGDRCTNWRETPGVFSNLTCHKAFRKNFLRENDIRFREGRVRLEDFLFMTAAYLYAERVTILGSRPLYVLERRDDGGNLTATRATEDDYWSSVEALIDLVCSVVEPGSAQDLALDRVVRSELAGPLSRPPLLRKEPEVQASALAHGRRILETKVPPSAVARLDRTTQARLDAVRRGDLMSILRQIEADQAVELVGRGRSLAWDGTGLRVDVLAVLQRDGASLTMCRAGESWVLPRLDSRQTPADLTASFAQTSANLRLRNRATAEVRRARLPVQPVDMSTTARPLAWAGAAIVEVPVFAAGQPLHPGIWDVSVEVNSCGFHRTRQVQLDESLVVPSSIVVDGLRVRPYRTQSGRLAIVVRPAVSVTLRARLRLMVRRTGKSIHRKWDSVTRPG
ncbi:glycosyltransferase [uncultured Jatrophihabitans sp.]|uniref:glycosyltransferase n=1 Tax=uncultured Jatrophihabitans sp. TaxID=1610747 RepID=UPI0035CB2CA3